MMIKLFAFPLVATAMLCGTVPVSVARMLPTAMNPSVESRPGRSQNELPPPPLSSNSSTSQKRLESSGQVAARSYKVYDDRVQQNRLSHLTQKEQEFNASRSSGESDGQLSQELNLTRNSLQQAKQRIEELEQQLASNNLEAAKRRIGELILQLSTKESELAALRSSTYDNSKKLRADLASQTEELNQAKRRVADLEQHAATGKEKDLTQAKRRVAELEQQTTGKEKDLAQAKRRVAELEQLTAGKDLDLAQTKRRVAELEQLTVGKDLDLAQTKRRVGELEQLTVGKDLELAQVKRRIADLEQHAAAGKDHEPTQAKRRPAELEPPTVTGKDQELALAKRRVTELEQQTAGKDKELAQAKEEIKQITQKFADLGPQLTARDAELARMKQQLADLERNSSKQVGSGSLQEENLSDKSPSPPLSVDQDLSVTNLMSPSPAVSDDAEALSSDLSRMSEHLASLLQPELKKGSVALKHRGTKLTLAFVTGELFIPGEATMTLGGASLLERIGLIVHGFRYQSVEVAGNTDNTLVRNDPRKGVRDNAELSQARAERASQTLINSGLDADRVKVVGYTDIKPTGANDTEKGRSKPRRVEIVITQWSESGSISGDTKTQIGKKHPAFSTQTVTHR